MNTNSCDHTNVILDRSGSMEVIKDDIINGFNSFLRDQKKLSSDSTLTLIQFDTINSYEVVHSFEPIEQIPELNDQIFKPRGGTPLLDCIGMAIKDLEEYVSANAERKLTKIFFVIITDGQENSSRKFSKEEIVKLIEEKQNKDHWEFIFLSSDLNAISEAYSLGFKSSSTGFYKLDDESIQNAFRNLSDEIMKVKFNPSYSVKLNKDRRPNRTK